MSQHNILPVDPPEALAQRLELLGLALLEPCDPAGLPGRIDRDGPDVVLLDGGAGDALACAAVAAERQTAAVLVGLALEEPVGEWLWPVGAGAGDSELVLALRAAAHATRAARRQREIYRAAVLGALAGSLAHEFNNIMTSVSGNAELALFDITADSAARASVEQIQLGVRRANQLTRLVLALSGRAQAGGRDVDLGVALRELQPLLALIVGKRSTLSLSVAEGPLPLGAEIGQLRHLLLNLALNTAVGVTPGLVEISAGPAPQPGYAELTVRFAAEQPSEHDRLAIGPAREVSASVRDPELRSARAAVRALGGELRVEGGGTIVRALLPLAL